MHIQRNTFVLAAALTCLVACQSGNQRSDREESLASADKQEQKSCFLRLEGQEKQDSSYIQLVVRDETVSGVYNVIPHEKDARRGTVMGKTEGDVIDLVWTFTQEGKQDTMRVVFRKEGEKLLRKPLSVNAETGRQVTRDSSAFTEAYEPIDCLSEQ